MSATSLMMLPQLAAPWHGVVNETVVDKVPPEMLHLIDGYCHPKYRAALKEKLPFLVCGETESDAASQASASSTATID